MGTLLQIHENIGSSLDKGLPSFSEILHYYGPYLGLIIVLIIIILILQYYWFKRLVNAKDEEIKRLVEREQEISERLIHLIDVKIDYKEKNQSNK